MQQQLKKFNKLNGKGQIMLKREDFTSIPLKNDKWKVTQEIVLDDCVIPNGFETNGADIPRIFWNIYPPYRSDYFPAIVAHDYRCKQAGKDYHKHKNADNKMKKELEGLGVNAFTCIVFHAGARFMTTIKYRIFS